MSGDDLGAVAAFQVFMRQAAEEIARGERKGATVLYGKAGGRSWHERQTLRQRWGRLVAFGQKRA